MNDDYLDPTLTLPHPLARAQRLLSQLTAAMSEAPFCTPAELALLRPVWTDLSAQLTAELASLADAIPPTLRSGGSERKPGT